MTIKPPAKPTTYGDIQRRTAAYAAREILRHSNIDEIMARYSKQPWWKRVLNWKRRKP